MRRVSLAAIALCLLSTLATAQEFPSRPITVIVPYTPGGTDAQMRILAPDLTRILGQQIVVENRPGAGGAIGVQAVKSAKPDGYTLLFTGTAVFSVLPSMRETSYTLKDFVPIGNVIATPLIVAIRGDLPYKTLDELIAYARQNPDKVLMGSGGTGTVTQTVGEALQQLAGVKFRHVPYGGIGAAVTAMLGGNFDVVFGLPNAIMPQVEAGKLRAIASTGKNRSEFATQIPTLLEAGYAIVEETRFGLFAPGGTPKDVTDKIEAAVTQIVPSPQFAEALRKTFTTVGFLNSKAFVPALQEEDVFWKKMFASPEFAKAVKAE